MEIIADHNNQKPRILVAMSGGVDSSLTAALLQEQGYEVAGAYMKNWAEDDDIFDCPWAQDIYDAEQVARQLGIDFQVFDLRQQYQQRVIEYMIAEYQAGRTPNPDVMCNQEMKFGLFWQLAQVQGFTHLATGHYARVLDGQLWTGLDPLKDQSYFLYRAPREAIGQALLPLGAMTKAEVRQQATQRGLVTAAKKDSQGICFIGKVKMKDFLRRYVATEPGPLVDQNGVVVGQHEGAIFYTIGQRNGMGVGGGKPYFVTGKDMATNTVFVTTEPQDQQLWRHQCVLTQLYWQTEMPEPGYDYQAQVRYHAPHVPARVELLGPDKAVVELSLPQRAMALGQSVVVYDNGRVLGGGVISELPDNSIPVAKAGDHQSAKTGIMPAHATP